MIVSDTTDRMYAPADLRDRFLNALDESDPALSVLLARDLTNCMNPLPGMAREKLGLPERSTYGAAARYVLWLHQSEK